jgi:hypothetical protein
MSFVTKIASLYQGATQYALDSLSDAANQCSLLNVPFSQVLTSLVVARNRLGSLGHGRLELNNEAIAKKQLEVLFFGDIAFAQSNLLCGARELRELRWDLEEILEFVATYTDRTPGPDSDEGQNDDGTAERLRGN